ncbi:MAG: 3-hydroxybutyryl-CoA dehydrogenase [Solirubrobacteraceae bacterium]|nr:3-hydroxybutyryl-CoA dehydrogenase [Solirubrobacteraceae bacterium]
MSRLPDVIGVVGAGTMGAGIAQLSALAGARTLIHDPAQPALDRALERIPAALERGAAKGRWSAEAASVATARIEAAPALEDLAPCELVIEAAPEALELKRELFAALSRITDGAVLASNTSSIPITAIAGAADDPQRVVGMHFFNPAPIMRLVEVVAGLESSEAALAVARATGEAMGKRVIEAADGPGFLVNRCSRPFGLEALKLLAERIADAELIDRVCRLGGGFRMGPFELSDLVGVDVSFDVARSFHEQSFGEPRWRPSPLAARMVAAGRLGRKTGRGWYAYDGGPHRPDDPHAPRAGGGDGRLIVIAGDLPLAEDLRGLAAAAGWAAVEPLAAEGEVPWLAVDCGAQPDEPPLQGAPLALLCADGSLHALDPGGGAAGFHALPPLDGGTLVELTRSATTTALAAQRTETFFASLGRHVAWVGDAPGLVLGRVVCQLINEACFAVGEGVGTPDDVDDGMVLGLNHPRGPFDWLEEIGVHHVVAVLDALHVELGEERYRVAPFLRHLGAEE